MNEVEQMQSGAELDKQYMLLTGWTKFGLREDGTFVHWITPQGQNWSNMSMGRTPAYSTTWEGMRLVVEELQRRGFDVHIDFVTFAINKLADCAIVRNGIEVAQISMQPSAPLAVCLAAIKTLEAQE